MHQSIIKTYKSTSVTLTSQQLQSWFFEVLTPIPCKRWRALVKSIPVGLHLRSRTLYSPVSNLQGEEMEVPLAFLHLCSPLRTCVHHSPLFCDGLGLDAPALTVLCSCQCLFGPSFSPLTPSALRVIDPETYWFLPSLLLTGSPFHSRFKLCRGIFRSMRDDQLQRPLGLNFPNLNSWAADFEQSLLRGFVVRPHIKALLRYFKD